MPSDNFLNQVSSPWKMEVWTRPRENWFLRGCFPTMNSQNTYQLHPMGHRPSFPGPRKGLYGWGSVEENGDHSTLPSS